MNEQLKLKIVKEHDGRSDNEEFWSLVQNE